MSPEEVMLLKNVSNFNPHNYPAQIIPVADAVADQIVEKIKINSYRRKITISGVRFPAEQKSAFGNIKATLELKEALKVFKSVGKQCKELHESKKKIIEQLENDYKETLNHISSFQYLLTRWKEFAEQEIDKMGNNLHVIEIASAKCNYLINVVAMAMDIRDTAINFYCKYSIYPDFVEKVKEFFNGCFDMMKASIEDYQEERILTAERFKECAEKLENVNNFMADLISGPFNECDTTLKECSHLSDLIVKEKEDNEKLKTRLLYLQEYRETVAEEYDASIQAINAWADYFLESLPDFLFTDLNKDNFRGKLLIIEIGKRMFDKVYESVLEQEKCAEKTEKHSI